MVVAHGKGVSDGIAEGPLRFLKKAAGSASRNQAAEPEAEWRRFEAARERTVEQIGRLEQKVKTEAVDEAVRLFEAYRVLAMDPGFEAAVKEGVRERGLNAEAAVAEAEARFEDMFASMKDEYLRERAADLRDVADRMVEVLSGGEQAWRGLTEPMIVAAEELSPSELMQLDRRLLLGVVMERGAENGHAAILARALGIPAVTGIGGQRMQEYDGRSVLIDGYSGDVLMEPERGERERRLEKRKRLKEDREKLMELKAQPCVTKDGQRLRICCNISGPEDAAAALEYGADGIGLFRSEFLYLNRENEPSEEEQFAVYKSVLSDMAGREVVIRTVDIGADKRADYLGLPAESNPSLGLRGIRFSLSRPAIFRTQLRALYRASVFGRLSILFPMVTSLWEVQESKRICMQVREELETEGIPYDRQVPLGIMIETPSAALMSDCLAEEADFFSCGTNDLTQYTLACDRQNSCLEQFANPHSPAVLRLLKWTADNARRHGIRVSICGELGADLELTEVFLAMGIDELSVAPRMVLPLKRKVRQTETAGEELLEKWLQI